MDDAAVSREFLDSQRPETHGGNVTTILPGAHTNQANDLREKCIGEEHCTWKRTAAASKAFAMYWFSAANKFDSTSRMCALSCETASRETDGARNKYHLRFSLCTT